MYACLPKQGGTVALSASAAAAILTTTAASTPQDNTPSDKSRKKLIVGMPVRPGSEDLDRAAMVLWASTKSHLIEQGDAANKDQDDASGQQVDDDDFGFSLFG
jgi:hypothetical protein